MQGKDKSEEKHDAYTSHIAFITSYFAIPPRSPSSLISSPRSLLLPVYAFHLFIFKNCYLRVGWAWRLAAKTEWKNREAMSGSTPVGAREGGREERNEVICKYVYFVEARVGLVFQLSSFPISLFTIPSLLPSLPPSLPSLPLPPSLPPFVPNSAGCAAMR